MSEIESSIVERAACGAGHRIFNRHDSVRRVHPARQTVAHSTTIARPRIELVIPRSIQRRRQVAGDARTLVKIGPAGGWRGIDRIIRCPNDQSRRIAGHRSLSVGDDDRIQPRHVGLDGRQVENRVRRGRQSRTVQTPLIPQGCSARCDNLEGMIRSFKNRPGLRLGRDLRNRSFDNAHRAQPSQNQGNPQNADRSMARD